MLEESISSSSPTFWSSLTSWFTPTIFFLLLQLVIATIYIISSLSNNNHKHQHQHEHHQQDPHEPNHLFQQQPLARSPSLLHRLKSINFYSYTHTSHETQHQQQQPQILRSPSSVLQRLKSINLCSYLPTEPLSSYFTTDTHANNLAPHEKPHVRETETPPPPQQPQEEEEHEEEVEEDDIVGEINNYNNLGVRHHDEDEGNFGNSTMDEVFSKLQQGQGGNFTRSHSDTKPESGEVPVRLPRKMRKSATTKSAFSHFEEADIVERRRPATVREVGAGVASTATAEEDGGVDAKADDFINRFKQQLKLQRLDSIMRYKEMIGRGGGK